MDNNIAGSRRHHTSTLGLSSNIKESMTVLSGCLRYWLMREIALHLTELGTQDWFVLITVSVNADSQALIRYEDGLDGERARQTIPYPDSPFDSLRLYACWDTEHWVIMLPSEY